MGQILTGQERALAKALKALLDAYAWRRHNLTNAEKDARVDAAALLDEMGAV